MVDDTPLLSPTGDSDTKDDVQHTQDQDIDELYLDAVKTTGPLARTEVVLAVAKCASQLFNVYIGLSLILIHEHYIAGGIWFLGMGVRVVILAALEVTSGLSCVRRAAGLLAVVCQLQPVYSMLSVWSAQRTMKQWTQSQVLSKADEQLLKDRRNALRHHERMLRSSAVMAVVLFVEEIPLLFVTKYQSVSTALDPSQDLALRQFVQLQLSAFLASFSMARSMFIAELTLSEPLRKKNKEHWLVCMRTLGLSSRRSRYVAMAYRFTSMVVRTLSFSLFLYVANTSDTYGNAYSNGFFIVLQYVLFAYFLSAIFNDSHGKRSSFTDYRQLAPNKHRSSCCQLSTSDNVSLAVWNIVSPTEIFPAFFPLANSPFRFFLVICYELSNVLGILAGYVYVATSDHVESLTVALVAFLGMYWVLDMVLMLTWMAMVRHTAWPMRLCAGVDPRYVKAIAELEDDEKEEVAAAQNT